jgi:hypothetical protein
LSAERGGRGSVELFFYIGSLHHETVVRVRLRTDYWDLASFRWCFHHYMKRRAQVDHLVSAVSHVFSM